MIPRYFNYSDSKDSPVRRYPLFKRNLKIEELYQKYEKKYNQVLIKRQITRGQLLWAITVLFLLLSVPFTLRQLQNKQTIKSQARQSENILMIEAESGKKTGNIIVGNDPLASDNRYLHYGSTGIWLDVTVCPQLPQNSESLTFNIDIKVSGEYYFWARIMAPDQFNNSFYLQVDDGCPLVIGDLNIPVNSWQWINNRAGGEKEKLVLNLSQGLHKIKIIGREPFLKLDKIILTNDELCIPVLKGENC